MKLPIFKDQQLQNQFDTEGFVKFRLFDEDEIQTLAHYCKSYFPEHTEGFFSSSYLQDFKLKEEISGKITEIIDPKIKKHLVDYRSLGAAFLIKGIQAKTEMPLHQDWTIVDESRYYSLNVWIPLSATNEDNGTIEVVKGSHLWSEGVRAPTLPFYFDGFQEELKKELTVINTIPGEVVILNQAIIHYSKPNTTNEVRPAISAGIISKEAQLLLHYWNKKTPSKIETYVQEDDLFLKFENFQQDIFKRPKGQRIGIKKYTTPKIDEVKFRELLGIKTKKRTHFFTSLFKRKK